MQYKQVDPEEVAKLILYSVTESFEELKQHFDWQLGIDESGRGPVIGPMMYSACYWPIKYHKLISETCNFINSKQLTEAARSRLFNVIYLLKDKVLQFETRELSAEYISKNQQSHLQTNLNEISHNTSAELIQSAIKKGFRISEIYVDTVGPKQQYQQFLQNKLSQEGKALKIVVMEKADSKYANVSAASICSRCIRNNKITQIQKEIMPKGSIGQGYPGDPKTRKYLENTNIPFFIYPQYIRFSWQTIKSIINGRNLNIEYKDEQEASNQVFFINHHFYKNKTSNYKFRSLAITNCILNFENENH